MNEKTLVHGTTEHAFTPVRHTFEAVATQKPGLSAQLSIYRRGAMVVDLCTGPEVAAAR